MSISDDGGSHTKGSDMWTDLISATISLFPTAAYRHAGHGMNPRAVILVDDVIDFWFVICLSSPSWNSCAELCLMSLLCRRSQLAIQVEMTRRRHSLQLVSLQSSLDSLTARALAVALCSIYTEADDHAHIPFLVIQYPWLQRLQHRSAKVALKMSLHPRNLGLNPMAVQVKAPRRQL